MTLDDALVKINRELDELYDTVMLDAARMLSDAGATPGELTTALRMQHEAFEDCRRHALACVAALFHTGDSGTVH